MHNLLFLYNITHRLPYNLIYSVFMALDEGLDFALEGLQSILDRQVTQQRRKTALVSVKCA